jgi:hypothetical protein
MESAEGTEECHKYTARYALSRPALEAVTREPTCRIQYRNKGRGRRLLEDLVLRNTPRPSFATVRDYPYSSPASASTELSIGL